MSAPADFLDVLRAHVQDDPEHEAVAFVRSDGKEAVTDALTYRELDIAARSVAARLDREGVRAGDRILLLHPQGLGFVKAFIGCVYAGAVPVPAPLPGGRRHHFARATGIVRDAEVALVLTDRANIGEIDAWLAESSDPVRSLAVEDAEDGGPGGWRAPRPGPSALAFLQYTSGSTSEPKGVMVTHANLLHNLGLIARSMGFTKETRFGSWLPLYHDMGLIGLFLEPLYLGASATLMSPTEFLKRPLVWLQLIDRRDIHITSAPNFAYELCVRRLTDEQIAGLDLSRWRWACNGAEPIDARTLASFSERFAPAGFRPEAFLPCYGMAETTLFIAGSDPDLPPATRWVDAGDLERNVFTPLAAEPAPDGFAGDRPARLLASSGTDWELEILIVDPEDHRVLPDGRIGEIWIKGGSVALGYWDNEEENERTFRAATADGRTGYLRTGDLGVQADGQLYVTGRIKEMLITHGRNLYPHDLERTARAVHPATAALTGSVFGVPADREEIVVVQEVRAPGADAAFHDALVRSIRTALSDELGVSVTNVVLIRPGKVRRTTSGKIQRRLMRELFLRNELEPLYEHLDPAVRARYRTASPEPVGAAV
ncbi:fatty acyl-AMP ligase [Streptomyces xanthophaeus]|uniref:fatty acyl-AMP ligase n=1 Tax=Streptomyces xanthophaeus TaxID=67385 RepID=UPI0026479F2B|nr:fatty acyl-AMP ligase [Streptomyces xanthophaeus]WKD32128.1 fatty acyl-AMP ligase [Streptomyces xanthophaeus]